METVDVDLMAKRAKERAFNMGIPIEQETQDKQTIQNTPSKEIPGNEQTIVNNSNNSEVRNTKATEPIKTIPIEPTEIKNDESYVNPETASMTRNDNSETKSGNSIDPDMPLFEQLYPKPKLDDKKLKSRTNIANTVDAIGSMVQLFGQSKGVYLPKESQINKANAENKEDEDRYKQLLSQYRTNKGNYNLKNILSNKANKQAIDLENRKALVKQNSDDVKYQRDLMKLALKKDSDLELLAKKNSYTKSNNSATNLKNKELAEYKQKLSKDLITFRKETANTNDYRRYIDDEGTRYPIDKNTYESNRGKLLGILVENKDLIDPQLQPMLEQKKSSSFEPTGGEGSTGANKISNDTVDLLIGASLSKIPALQKAFKEISAYSKKYSGLSQEEVTDKQVEDKAKDQLKFQKENPKIFNILESNSSLISTIEKIASDESLQEDEALGGIINVLRTSGAPDDEIIRFMKRYNNN